MGKKQSKNIRYLQSVEKPCSVCTADTSTSTTSLESIRLSEKLFTAASLAGNALKSQDTLTILSNSISNADEELSVLKSLSSRMEIAVKTTQAESNLFSNQPVELKRSKSAPSHSSLCGILSFRPPTSYLPKDLVVLEDTSKKAVPAPPIAASYEKIDEEDDIPKPSKKVQILDLEILPQEMGDCFSPEDKLDVPKKKIIASKDVNNNLNNNDDDTGQDLKPNVKLTESEVDTDCMLPIYAKGDEELNELNNYFFADKPISIYAKQQPVYKMPQFIVAKAEFQGTNNKTNIGQANQDRNGIVRKIPQTVPSTQSSRTTGAPSTSTAIVSSTATSTGVTSRTYDSSRTGKKKIAVKGLKNFLNSRNAGHPPSWVREFPCKSKYHPDNYIYDWDEGPSAVRKPDDNTTKLINACAKRGARCDSCGLYNEDICTCCKKCPWDCDCPRPPANLPDVMGQAFGPGWSQAKKVICELTRDEMRAPVGGNSAKMSSRIRKEFHKKTHDPFENSINVFNPNENYDYKNNQCRSLVPASNPHFSNHPVGYYNSYPQPCGYPYAPQPYPAMFPTYFPTPPPPMYPPPMMQPYQSSPTQTCYPYTN